jgi:hypothetical protein
MKNKEVSQIIRKVFNSHLNKLTLKARAGNKKAATSIMHIMAAETLALQALGFQINDNGRLVILKYYK